MKHQKDNRIRLPQQVVAFWLAWMMLFTMLPIQLISAENETDTGALQNGIGIYNHILTSLTGLQTNYQVDFYQLVSTSDPSAEGEPLRYHYEKKLLPGELELTDTSGSIVYLSNSGVQLQQERTLQFLDNQDLKAFLINNRIARIVITPQLTESRNDEEVDVFVQYPTAEGFRGDLSEIDLDSTNPPTGDPAANIALESTSRIYLLQYNESQTGSHAVTIKEDPLNPYKVKRFDLTPMIDLDVYVQWRDTNGERPDPDSVSFEISRAMDNGGSLQYEQYPAAGTAPLHRSVTVQDSDNVIYTYSVPEKAQDGRSFLYRAEEFLPDGANYTITAEDNTHFTNYSLIDFDCRIDWHDTGRADSITKSIDLDFISRYFDLVDETDPDHPVNVPYFYDMNAFSALDEGQQYYVRHAYAEVTDENDQVIGYRLGMNYEEKMDTEGKTFYELRFRNLPEITSDGTARIYSVKQISPTNIPVDKVETLADEYMSGRGNDGYYIVAENAGVLSNTVDRVFKGGKLIFVLTGTDTFEGELVWADLDNRTAREEIVAAGNPGDFLLYRYVIDPDNPNSWQMVSQVGTWTIRDEAYTEGGQTKHRYVYADQDGNPVSIEKYDNTGKEYFYFAKERLSASMLPGYTAAYVYSGVDNYPFGVSDQGIYHSSGVFPNHATVKNALMGSVAYGVDAKWIAAELQGGEADIHYILQRFNPLANPVTDPDTGETTYTPAWENVEQIYHPADQDAGTEAFTEGMLDFLSFSAETMEKDGVFSVVNQYDETGHAFQYRVVQIGLKRTDGGHTETFSDPVMMASDADGKLLLGPADSNGLCSVRLLDSQGNPCDQVTITTNGNSFAMSVKYDSSTQTFYYEYRLIGNVRIVLNKDFDPVPRQQLLNAYNAKITLQLMKYNYTTGGFESYRPGFDIRYTDGTPKE